MVVAKSGKYPSVVGKKNNGRIDYFSAALVPQEHALQEKYIILLQGGAYLFDKGLGFRI